jgi:hypothetical protein
MKHVVEKTKTSSKKKIEGWGKIPANSTIMTAFDPDFNLNEQLQLGSITTIKQDNFDYIVYTGIYLDKKDKTAGNFFMKIDLNKGKEVSKTVTNFDVPTAKLYDEMDALPWTGKEKLISYKTVLDKTTEDVYSISYGATQGIFVTKFMKDGQVRWTKAIPRSADKQRPGFGYALSKGRFYFICLDNPKNMEGVDITNFSFDKVKGYGASTGQNVVCFSIDDNGKISKSVLGNNDFSTLNFIVPELLDFTASSYYGVNTDLSAVPIFRYSNGKREQFVRFKFE